MGQPKSLSSSPKEILDKEMRRYAKELGTRYNEWVQKEVPEKRMVTVEQALRDIGIDPNE